MTRSPYDDGWLLDLDVPCVRVCLHDKHAAMLTTEDIQRICAEAAHEVNRVYCQALGDLSQVVWANAPAWQQQSALRGVAGVFAGNGPEASHQSWLAEKTAEGWKYGAVKNVETKEHPCFVPYAALSEAAKQKDHLFVATVRALAAALGQPVVTAVGVTMGDGLEVTPRGV